MSGCSCTIVIHRATKLYVANIGDTRAIVFRNAVLTS